MVHLVVCGFGVVGAHLFGRDIHRDGADDGDLGYRFAVVLDENLAHSLAAGQWTIYRARHLVFKTYRTALQIHGAHIVEVESIAVYVCVVI